MDTHAPGRGAPAEPALDVRRTRGGLRYHEGDARDTDLHETEPDHFVACAGLPDCGRTPA